MIFKAFLSFFLLIGLILLAFCWWGVFTAAGQAEFSEMAGLLPFYAGALGGAIILLTGLLYLFHSARARRHVR